MHGFAAIFVVLGNRCHLLFYSANCIMKGFVRSGFLVLGLLASFQVMYGALFYKIHSFPQILRVLGAPKKLKKNKTTQRWSFDMRTRFPAIKLHFLMAVKIFHIM